MAKSSLVWMMAVRTLVRARPPRSRRLSLSLTVVSDVSAAPMMRSIQPDRSTSCLANRAEPLCKGLPFGRALGVTAIGVRARIAASRRPRRGRRPAAPISSSAVGVVERGGLAGRAERRLTWLDLCSACKGLGKRITVDVDKLLDLDRSVEQGAIRHPAYDIGKWYWREIVQTEVVPPRKSLRRFTAAERERLLWSDDVRIEKVHQGATYERTFEGVARKLERLHVDKGRGSDPARRQGGLSAAVHRAGVPRLRRGSAQRRGAGGGARVVCGRGRNPTLSVSRGLWGSVRGQRYSPVRLMCSQPSGETWARNSAGISSPAFRLAKTASPSFNVFQ